MLPYYRVNTPGNDIATTVTAIRTQYYFLVKNHLPTLDTDFELSCTTFSSLTGLSRTKSADIIMAMHRLKQLPLLQALQESLFHLDFNRLIVIDQVIAKLGTAPADVLERIDGQLTDYLTPTKEGQELPSTRNLRRKLNALIAAEDPELKRAADSSDSDSEPSPTYETFLLPGGQAALSATFDTATTALLDETIAQTAQRLGISKPEALKRLVLGEAANTSKIILNVYKATDLPNAPVYIHNFGWADPNTGALLEATAATTRDMNEGARQRSDNYVTPEIIKSYIEGRDGHCRYPGCATPAYRCQKDHCKDHAAGGDTASWNLVNLCQHHHNVKTDKRARYILDPATGDVMWLFGDGTWQVTVADGPLSPANCHWLQTVDQAIKARNTTAHHNAVTVSEPKTDPEAESKPDDEQYPAPPF